VAVAFLLSPPPLVPVVLIGVVVGLACSPEVSPIFDSANQKIVLAVDISLFSLPFFFFFLPSSFFFSQAREEMAGFRPRPDDDAEQDSRPFFFFFLFSLPPATAAMTRGGGRSLTSRTKRSPFHLCRLPRLGPFFSLPPLQGKIARRDYVGSWRRGCRQKAAMERRST